MPEIKKGLSGLLVLLIGFTLAGCGPQEEAKQEVIRPVKSIVVGGDGASLKRTFPGKIRAAEKVDLAFQVSGQLTKLNVRNGQEVKKGEILAQLDNRDFVSNLKAAKAEFNRAQAQFERMAELVERQLVSRSEYDQKKASRDVAESDVERTQKALNDTSLRAPFAGVIANRHVENFQDVTAKQAIISLQDPSDLEVVINIPENSILRATADRSQINPVASFDALPDKQFTLNLKEFATQADPNTQTFELVFIMDSPEGLTVLPGMSVSVTASVPDRNATSTVKTVPATALFADREGGNSQYVWIINEADMSISRRAVQVGSLRGQNVEVIEGVSSGERIVTAGVHYLEEGQKVSLLNIHRGG